MRPDGNQALRPSPLGRQRAPYLAHAMPIQPQPRAVRRAELISLLRLPANARLQFGGREWLQDFDDEACLIVTVPR